MKVGPCGDNCVDDGTGKTTFCGNFPAEFPDGVCANTQIDASHCGDSCTDCAIGAECNSGSCQCIGLGQTVCSVGGLDQCGSTQTDATHCGSSCTDCTKPPFAVGETCRSGSCQCPSGQTACGGHCVSTQTDLSNCGGCTTPTDNHVCRAAYLARVNVLQANF